MRLIAGTLGRTARRLLLPGLHAEAHSVFAAGVNLVTPQRDLIVVTSEPQRAPWAVHVPGWANGVGNRVDGLRRALVAEDGTLVFSGEDIRIDLQMAVLWEPDAIYPLASLPAIRAALARAALPKFPPGLLGYGWDEDDFARLRKSTESNLLDDAGKLIGLGQGLTPAGDDFLAGLLGTLTTVGQRHVSLSLQGRTSLLSETQLAYAACGALAEYLHDAIRLLAQAHPAASRATQQLLGLGHTSGADMLAGVRLGFEHLLAAV